MKYLILTCFSILLCIGCANNTMYILEAKWEMSASGDPIYDLNLMLQSEGLIPDSNSSDEYFKNSWLETKSEDPTYINTWRIFYPIKYIFLGGGFVFIRLNLVNGTYVFNIRPSSVDRFDEAIEYRGLIKGWFNAKYPSMEIEIKEKGFVDFS